MGARGGCPMLLLARLLMDLVSSAASFGLQPFASVKFEPPFVHELIAGENATVRMTLSVDPSHIQFSQFRPQQPWKIALKSMDEEIATTVGKEREIMLSDFSSEPDGLHRYEMNFTVDGRFLGKTAIRVLLLSEDNNSDFDDPSLKEIPREHNKMNGFLDVWVSQEKGRLVNRMFLSTLVILIVFANILMGCELDTKMVVEAVKKPIAPAIGVCTQFIAMPLLAYGIAHAVFLSRGQHSFALGVFVTGCAPGGGASNYWTLLLDGNLPISVTMTFISTLAALAMMPLWMWAFGAHFLRGSQPGAHIKVPYHKIITSLFTMVVPLLVGVALSRWKPSFRSKARKCMRPFIIFVLVFLVGFGAAANWYMFRIMTWTALIGGLLLPWCGFMIGCFAAMFTGQPPPTVTAIAVETGIQNTGIAIMLLKFSFPEPDSDISALIPVISASLTPIPLLLLVAIHEALKRWRARREAIQSRGVEAAKVEVPGKAVAHARHAAVLMVNVREERILLDAKPEISMENGIADARLQLQPDANVLRAPNPTM